MRKKTAFIFMLLLFATVCLFATDYKIKDYNINVDGRTRVSAIKNLIVPDNEEVFSSETELVSALYQKQLILNDTNLFRDVTYEYSLLPLTAETYYADVTFNVVDASSFIAFPFPKFSTDDGLSFKMVVKEHNFLKVMAQVDAYITATTRGEGLAKSLLTFSFPVSNLKIGETNVDFELYGAVDLKDKTQTYASVSSDVYNFKIRDVAIDSTMALTVYPSRLKNSKFDFRIAAKNMRIGNVVWDISNVQLTYSLENKFKFTDFKTSFSGIKIGKNATYQGNFHRYANSAGDSIVEFVNTISNIHVSSNPKVPVFTFDNTTSLNIDHIGFDTSTSISFRHGKKNWGTALNFKTFETRKDGLTGFDINLNTSRSFGFGSFITVSPNFSFTNTFRKDTSNKYKRTSDLGASISFSGRKGQIHRFISGESYMAFRDNFKDGYEFVLSGSASVSIKNRPTFKLLSSWTWYEIFTNRFNPSIRLGLSLDTGSKNCYSSSNAIGAVTFTYDNVKDYLRGITASNEKFRASNEPLFLFGNINLISAFLNFEDFGHTYVNAFMDFGMFIPTTSGKHSQLFRTIGFEGVAILDSHPLYPIRVSLGLNFDDFLDKFIFKKEGAKLEYELFVGLNWLY